MDASRYIQNSPDPSRAPGGALEKEHVMVAIRICINGRKGVVLCDPGYHVARVVTVMADEKYPHTGKEHAFGFKLQQILYKHKSI